MKQSLAVVGTSKVFPVTVFAVHDNAEFQTCNERTCVKNEDVLR